MQRGFGPPFRDCCGEITNPSFRCRCQPAFVCSDRVTTMPPCSVRASVFAKRRSAVTRCASIPWARQHLVEAASTAWRPGRSTWLPSDVPRPVRRDDQRLARGRGGSAQTQGRQCRRAGIRVRSCSRSAGRPWILGTLCEPRSRRGDRVAESSVKRKRARSGDVSPPWARPLYGIPQECRMQCTQMAVTLGPSDWRKTPTGSSTPHGANTLQLANALQAGP